MQDSRTIDHTAFVVADMRSAYLTARHATERVAIVLCSPLLVVLCCTIAAMIKIDSRGPVFYLQERPGIGTSTFMIWKFRTMYHELCNTGNAWTAKNDPRVTRVGRLLRTMHLDELPQCYNVFLGEMTVIGPRPEPLSNMRESAALVPEYHLRRAMHPGITGLAQVQQGYTDAATNAGEKLKYDLQYMHTASPWVDCIIIAKTISRMIVQFA
jgi:lipopolysaccharide/colanic/teichoic acid biosynthesis glycosyltransferase